MIPLPLIFLGLTQCPVKEEWKDRVALPVEDYLHGVISVVNELVSTDKSELCFLKVFAVSIVHDSPGWR